MMCAESLGSNPVAKVLHEDSQRYDKLLCGNVGQIGAMCAFLHFNR